MTEHRALEAIAADIKAQRDAIEIAQIALRELNAEYDAARLATASHPWLGKKVKGTKRTYRGETPVYGRVAVYAGGYSRHPNLSLGEIYVASLSGKTAYRLEERYSWDITWELADHDE